MSDERKPLGLYLAAAAFLLIIIAVVVASFTRREVPEFLPSPIQARTPSDAFVVDTVTIDARDGSKWAYFDFEVGAVRDGAAAGWDLAVNRFHIVVNGGRGYAGAGGALAFEAPWDSLTEAPSVGYTTTEGNLDSEPVTPALDRWYTYSFFAHTLDPKDETYVVRTAEGRYAKFRILAYYCPQASPGCLTVVYGFQGDGTRRLTP